MEQAVSQMQQVLPQNHPEVAFFRHWKAKALWRQAEAEAVAAAAAGAGGSRSSRKGSSGPRQVSSAAASELHRRACKAAAEAADLLAVSHGEDHPTVARWRRTVQEAGTG